MVRKESEKAYCNYLRCSVDGSDGLLIFFLFSVSGGTGNLQIEKFVVEFFDRSRSLELV